MADGGQAVKLGRLKTLGVEHHDQLALYFPAGWDDNRQPLRLEDVQGSVGNFCLVLKTCPNTFKITSKGAGPELIGLVQGFDFNHAVEVRIKGTAAELKRIESHCRSNLSQALPVRANIRIVRGQPVLDVTRVLSGDDIGRVVARYNGRSGVIAGATVTNRISEALSSNPDVYTDSARWFLETLLDQQNISERREIAPEDARKMVLMAIARILGILDASEKGILDRIAFLITRAHGRGISKNADMEAVHRMAAHAQDTICKVAAMGAYLKARQNTPSTAKAARFSTPGSWETRTRTLPYPLTDEQSHAIERIVLDIVRGKPVRYLILGDVGTGKTVIFATVAMTVLDGGGRVSIMLPRQTLAEQIYSEMIQYWPDLIEKNQVALMVNGKVFPPEADLETASLLIGTTALLSQSSRPFDLVIADEQQLYSREQREQLADSETHFIESSATVIPRTQALMMFGAIKQVLLTKPHTEKVVHTSIVTNKKSERGEMMARIRQVLKDGGQVLAVYPSKKDRPDYPLLSAESMVELWEKIAPGRVRIAHGGLKPAENAEAIRAVKNREADILVATTVVEVGLTIPGLRYVAIAHPDRYGLSQLHQLRGRLCRHGGTGYFDLVFNKDTNVTDSLLERLQVLVDTNSGFEIAERDMYLRGSGDLGSSSSQQRGNDKGLLPNRVIAPSDVFAAMETLKALSPLINRHLKSKPLSG